MTRRTRRQHFGQHYLHNPGVIQHILELAQDLLSTSPSDTSPWTRLVEIGPGDLALTKDLARLAELHRIPFSIVEYDPKLLPGVESWRSEHSYREQISVLHQDAARPEFGSWLRNSPCNLVVSNLPYSASSQILAQLCQAAAHVPKALVMVQKELALRMLAGVPKHPSEPKSAPVPFDTQDRGAFSILIQSYFHVLRCFDVEPGSFSPPPQVQSTVLTLTALEKPLTQNLVQPVQFEEFCKFLFSQRRKMIRRILPSLGESGFSSLNLQGTERPEVLTNEEVLALFLASRSRSESP